MNERRAATRVEPSEPIPAKLKSSLPARVLDISVGGIQVEVATSLRPEADCELRVQLADSEVVLRAHVRRCRAWGFGLDENDRRVLLYRAGLQFSSLPDDVLSKLRGYVEPIAADAVPEPAARPASVPGPPPGVDAATAEPTSALPQAPRRSGPVKIRINSEHVRRILGTNGQDS